MKKKIVYPVMVLCLFTLSAQAPTYYKLSEDGRENSIRKKVVVDWMQERSAETREVLEKIYDSIHRNTNMPELYLALAAVESSYRPQAISNRNAHGLLQVVPRWWLHELKKENIVRNRKELLTIDGGIRAGVYVLEKYMHECRKEREDEEVLDCALEKYIGQDRGRTYRYNVYSHLASLYITLAGVDK